MDSLSGVPARLRIVVALARRGYRVAVFGAAALLDEHAALASDAIEIRRGAGLQRIRFASGGTVIYSAASSPAALRGFEADIVCVPAERISRLRREAHAVIELSRRPGAGLYGYDAGSDRLVLDDRGLGDLVAWMREALGLTVEPWQRKILEGVIAGRRSA